MVLGQGLQLSEARNPQPLLDEMQAGIEHYWSHDATRKWLEELIGAHGNLVAMRSLGHLKGLPGYKPYPFWRTFLFGSALPVDLVVAERSLLLFDPGFTPDARMTAVPFAEISKVNHNLGDGAIFIVHLKSGGKIKLRAIHHDAHGAIPIVTIVRPLLQ